jgi:hypothetical protein
MARGQGCKATDAKASARGSNALTVAIDRPEELADLRREVDDRLEELKLAVEEQLPWVGRGDGRPMGMWVDGAGYIEHAHSPHPPGTPYVVVAVNSWPAAEAVCEALYETARVDDAYWLTGWAHDAQGVMRIELFPHGSDGSDGSQPDRPVNPEQIRNLGE